jgi:hypothetical protein
MLLWGVMPCVGNRLVFGVSGHRSIKLAIYLSFIGLIGAGCVRL